MKKNVVLLEFVETVRDERELIGVFGRERFRELPERRRRLLFVKKIEEF